MKKLILISLLFSNITFATGQEEYIFKVNKSKYDFKVIQSDNSGEPQLTNCSPQQVTWNSCSAMSIPLVNGATIELNNTTENNTGQVSLTCTNGVLSLSNPTCEPKPLDCIPQEITWNNCSATTQLISHGSSIDLDSTNQNNIGKVSLTCTNGVLNQSNPTCETKIDCFDPSSIGLTGNDGECKNKLIVNNTMLVNLVNSSGDYSSSKIFTGQVTSLLNLFLGKTVLHDITGWNTSNVTNMQSTFRNSPIFNQDISNWNTSKVTNMAGMFNGAVSFNQPIGKWNTSSLNSMILLGQVGGMFKNAQSFNQSINNWDVSKVTTMTGLFMGASSFNQPLNNWDVSNVTNMVSMFASASYFNQPLDNWNVSNVTNFNGMFSYTTFNQPLNNWNMSKAQYLTNMFNNNYAFNQPLNNWNVSNVLQFGGMFNYATKFNQNISNWNTNSVVDFSNFKTGSPLTQENTPPMFN